MNEREILLRYHEIALKGDNRSWFEDRLAINARKLFKRGLSKDFPFNVKKVHGRIIIQSDWNEETQEILKNRLFGLSSFSPMTRVETQLEAIKQKALEEFQSYVQKFGLPSTFRIKSRRSDKALPETSPQIDRILGAWMQEHYPSLKVDLENAQFTLGVEVRFQESYIWTEIMTGQGGLPVGTNGSVLTLLSGGIDSPVAAIQILRRGSQNHFIHFYGAPFVGEEVLDKIRDLVKTVNRYQPDPQPLYVVPFGKIQEKIALVTNPKMRTLLYRRMMVRIANEVAKKVGAQALVTGESLGQVASQTVENLATVNSVSELPILRPLISFDKDEIIERARKWGSYEISIRPATDCCTLFADRHPTLRSNLSLLEEQETQFSVPDLVQEALEGIQIETRRSNGIMTR
jgi:thiamine biosynthesis protein ThiI